MLQCAWRGNRAYNKYKRLLKASSKKKDAAARVVQKAWRGASAAWAEALAANAMYENYKQNWSAEKIAALWRGHVQVRVQHMDFFATVLCRFLSFLTLKNVQLFTAVQKQTSFKQEKITLCETSVTRHTHPKTDRGALHVPLSSSRVLKWQERKRLLCGSSLWLAEEQVGGLQHS